MIRTSRQYLNDTELDAQLAEQGFVVVPMLSSDEVESLRKTFLSAHQNGTDAFYATSHHQSADFRKSMSKAVSEVLNPHGSVVFNNCDLLGASFISKAPNSESSLQPHQDWNIVDETKFRSFNVWIPLIDLNETNGAIEVVPKSHNWVRGFRHSSIDCAYRNVHDLVWKNMKPLYMKAGQALIYDHALLHASKANNSGESRIAIACGLMPTEAEMFFYWNNHGVVEQYESNVDFFMTENIFSGPGNLKKVAELEYDFPTVEVGDFYRFMGKEPPKVEEEQAPTVDVNPELKKPFWRVYTPLNIIREINYRLTTRK